MPRQKIDNLVFELTEACNQRCRFCYNYWRDGSTPLPPPDPGLARRTLRKLLSQASVGTISFSGGEPTLMPGYLDLALKARFKGSAVNVLTNGSQITEDTVRNMKEIGIGALVFSLFWSLMGLTNMCDAVQMTGDVSPAILFAGFKVVLIPIIYGLIVYFISLIRRIIPKPRI